MCAPNLAGHARRPLLPLLLQLMVEVEGICLYWSLMCSAIIMVQVQRVEGGTMFLAIRRWSPHGPPVRLQRPTSTTKHGWRVLLQEPSRPGALMHAERSCGRLCATPCFDTPGHVLTACACVFDYLNSLLSSLSVCPNIETTTLVPPRGVVLVCTFEARNAPGGMERCCRADARSRAAWARPWGGRRLGAAGC